MWLGEDEMIIDVLAFQGQNPEVEFEVSIRSMDNVAEKHRMRKGLSEAAYPTPYPDKPFPSAYKKDPSDISEPWKVKIYSVEQIFEIIEKYDTSVIINRQRDGKCELEIYDDDREAFPDKCSVCEKRIRPLEFAQVDHANMYFLRHVICPK